MHKHSRSFSCVALTALLQILNGWTASAQTNIEVNQGIQIDFLNPGARSLAMGGAFVGLADDATAALANPAGLRALTRTEFSVEGRARNFKTPFVFGGRLNGSTANLGVDTSAVPDIRTTETSETTPSFVSGVYASAKHNWTLAAFRHETLKYSTNMTTSGAFNTVTIGSAPGSYRYFPAIGDLALHIVDYGVSGSIKWQQCRTVAGVNTCDDRFAVGAGFSYYTFSINSTLTRYSFSSTTSTSPGFFYGPPLYTTKVNYQTQTGDDTNIGGTVGALLIPNKHVQLGVSYRKGVKFSYTAQNFSGSTSTGLNSNTAAQFNLPDEVTVGVALRPASSTVVVLDYSRVQFSQLMRGFLNVFPSADTERVSDYSVPDVNQFRLGLEHQFTSVSAAPAVRLGAWFDPDHALRNSQPFTQFTAGKDVWHYTAGGGVVVDHVEISAGGDFSKRGNIASVSAVFRF